MVSSVAASLSYKYSLVQYIDKGTMQESWLPIPYFFEAESSVWGQDHVAITEIYFEPRSSTEPSCVICFIDYQSNFKLLSTCLPPQWHPLAVSCYPLDPLGYELWPDR